MHTAFGMWPSIRSTQCALAAARVTAQLPEGAALVRRAAPPRLTTAERKLPCFDIKSLGSVPWAASFSPCGDVVTSAVCLLEPS